MIKHHFRELTKSFGSRIDPEKSEELKRTKTDIENNLSRILKLIQNQDQIIKDENPRKDTELVGLIEDVYNQYASLYTLYGGILGECARPVPPRRARRVSSMSCSSSDSEYFSAEEEDNNYRTAIRYKVVNTRASHQAKENDFEEQLSSQMKELESLNHQKKTLELKVESQALEVKKLRAKNVKLHARVFEFQLLLKKTEGAVSVLHTKLKKNEDQPLSKIAELMARINKLEQEGKSLRSQNGKMEEKIRRSRNETLSQRKDFTEQINVMQQKFDSACCQNKELEAELETERAKVSQQFVRIENLAETNAVERQCFLAKVKELEQELESRCNTQNSLEEQLREMNIELERAMTHKVENVFDDLSRDHEGVNNEPSICDLRLELDNLQEQKNNLELHNERITKEYSESIARFEAQVSDQEKTIKKQEEIIDKIRAENKEAEIWSKKLKLTQQLVEGKMEELAQEFMKKMEDNICELHEMIHEAQQVNNENKENCKKTTQRYEQENKLLGEKVSSYENELVMNGLNCLELDFVTRKLDEHREYVLSHVSKMLREVQLAKDWIRKRNEEIKQVEDKVDHLREKEEQELLLREKVSELEKNLKEKDEELVALGEMKREAIRQLCIHVEFNRQRYSDHLKDLVPKERKK